MELKFKKNEKWNKVILIILCGILLLVIAMPMKTSQTTGQIQTTRTQTDGCVEYENRLRALLEDTYGEGNVDVMIYCGQKSTSYYSMENESLITGVLITIRQEAVGNQTVAQITLAVCALFDLPAHKVAVLVKK